MNVIFKSKIKQPKSLCREDVIARGPGKAYRANNGHCFIYAGRLEGEEMLFYLSGCWKGKAGTLSGRSEPYVPVKSLEIIVSED